MFNVAAAAFKSEVTTRGFPFPASDHLQCRASESNSLMAQYLRLVTPTCLVEAHKS